MYEEEFDDGSTYTRLDQDDSDQLRGMLIKGVGRITGFNHYYNDLHPTMVHFDDWINGDNEAHEPMPLHDLLLYHRFDGRHNVSDPEMLLA